MTKLFRNDPRYVLIAYLFYAYGAWGWQFYNGHNSPIQQLSLMYELPSSAHS